MSDGKQTMTNFNQTLHDINTINKNFDINTKSKELSNTETVKKGNNLIPSDEKTIEMYKFI